MVTRQSNELQHQVTNTFLIKECVGPLKDFSEQRSLVSLLLTPQSRNESFEKVYKVADQNDFEVKQGMIK